MNDRQKYRRSLGLPKADEQVDVLPEHEPGAPCTLTDVIVDELRARADRAELRVKALLMAIARVRQCDPHIADHILDLTIKIETEETDKLADVTIETFMAKARAM